MKPYNPNEIEPKWQEYWDKNQTFKTDIWDFSKPKFYALDMFPYPSGVGLHAGHPEGYTATDIVARMKKMQGYNVLHPMGFDSFGLPAEQFAIKTGNHPNGFTKRNIETFRKQLKMLGFSYDWDRQISTSDPSYYKWTQWIFKQLFEDGLAKCVDMPVNWCEELGTVLANDEIIDGKSERGGFPVVRKNMRQWVIDIPAYAEKLLSGLDNLDWPESTKEMQRNWIGKSIGAHVDFEVAGTDEKFTVFTTRCDTLFGATYCVLSPEHPLVDKITTPEQAQAVKEYKVVCASKSDLERTELNKDKTGVFTGAYAINPVNGKNIPIWISDYVLVTYGTGAIMAVPAHDDRDYAFAKKFGLEIIEVLEGGDISKEAYTADGKHVNSGFLDGMGKREAIDAMTKWLEERGIGKKKVNYKLREWIFARQRYWGEPIPVLHLENGDQIALSDSELPLVLPELESYAPSKTGESPLARATDWVNVKIDGKPAKRETSTMPGSAGSSWYFLRYIDPHNDKEIADRKLMEHWMPVDLYMGGPEHAVGHLLYSRMWNNYLFDKGIVPVKEPFQKLVHQGMILGANGIKMGKRFPEFVVDPNDVVRDYGADTLRLYEMFMGPIEVSKPWNPSGVSAARKFLDRVYRMFADGFVVNESCKELAASYHQTVKKVTEDFESLGFNTAISQMMIFVNDVYKIKKLPLEYAEGFVKLLAPICPHIAEELWHEAFGHTESIANANWPTYDEKALVKDEIELPVQVLGRVRGVVNVPVNASQEEACKIALADAEIAKYITSEPKKIIYVAGRILNFII